VVSYQVGNLVLIGLAVVCLLGLLATFVIAVSGLRGEGRRPPRDAPWWS
jgi:hypothetical protein